MQCLVARYGERGLRFRLPEVPVEVGSRPGADLILPFPGVSRRHARLQAVPGGVVVTDLGSRHGLAVGDRKLREVLLVKGMQLQLGAATLSIEEESTSDLEVAFAVSRSPKGPRDVARPERETDSGVVGGGSPAAALRFIRELEHRGPLRAGDLFEAMDAARPILGAAGLVLFGLDGAGSPVARAVAGAFPVDTLLPDLLPLPAHPPGQGRKDAQRWLHAPVLRVVQGCEVLLASSPAGEEGGPRALAAVFSPGSGPDATWKHELFGFLAHRLLKREALEPASNREDHPAARFRRADLPEVVVPEGMVIGGSDAMTGLLRQIRTTVRSRMDVLLLGETGTGKELFAKLVHLSGPRPDGPFVPINCAAIPLELLESELFGIHGRIATGVDPHVGRVLQAEGGSLFLDEIGELAPPLQAKLLRFLQEREVHPLGAQAPRKVDLRVISASNRDLEQDVRDGRFRADLFYRLRGLRFHIPPLRDCREDVPAYVLRFAQAAAAEHGKRVDGISRKALSVLTRHDWPGNVRELQAEVHRAVLLCPDGGTLMAEHFGPVLWAVEKEQREREAATPATAPPSTAAPAPGPAPVPPTPEPAAPPASFLLQDRVDAVERATIEEALRASGGNKTKAAGLLGITRGGLLMKMKRLLGGDGQGSR